MTPPHGPNPPQPRQELLGPGHTYRLLEDYVYPWVVKDRLCRITVPRGFVHDAASVPRVFWSLISPLDLDAASVVHDWIYRHRGKLPFDSHQIWMPDFGWVDALERIGGPNLEWSRKDADRLFARHMREAGVVRWRRRAAYRAVRVFGRRAWGRVPPVVDPR